MRTNAVNVVFFLLALALGLAMAQLPVSCLEMRERGEERVFGVVSSSGRGERRRVCLFFLFGDCVSVRREREL